MKNKDRVFELLKLVKEEMTTEQELHFVEECERRLNGDLPRVEVIDEKHQRFNGEIYNADAEGYHKRTQSIHRAVWAYFNGPIPNGYVVHHIEEDPSKNNIEDLKLMTEEEHNKLHEHIHPTYVEITCKQCGGKTIRRNSGRNQFCSKSCMEVWHYEHKTTV